MTRDEREHELMGLSSIQEITTIGLKHAASALSQMTGEPFQISVPDVESLSIERMTSLFGAGEELVVAVYMAIAGEADGHIAFLMPWSAARAVLKRLTGNDVEDFEVVDDLAASALLEVGKIINSSFMSAISDKSGLTMHATPPVMAIEMASAVLYTVATEATYRDQTALSIRTSISDRTGQIEGYFVYIPTTGGLRRLFERLRISEAA